MNKANKYHQQAMELAEQGDVAKRRKAHAQAQELFQKAFVLERHAAIHFVDQLDAEPTRSVLLRSAASLALDCGELREAERLIGAVLFGNPPEEIRQELRDVLIQLVKRPTPESPITGAGTLSKQSLLAARSGFPKKLAAGKSIKVGTSKIKPKQSRNGSHAKSTATESVSKKNPQAVGTR